MAFYSHNNGRTCIGINGPLLIMGYAKLWIGHQLIPNGVTGLIWTFYTENDDFFQSIFCRTGHITSYVEAESDKLNGAKMASLAKNRWYVLFFILA